MIIRKYPPGHLEKLIRFLINWGVQGFCFTGDTKVSLVSGENKTFEELSKDWEKNKRPFEVFSRNERGEVVPALAYKPRITREVTTLIELELDNGEKIKCTPDHLIMVNEKSTKPNSKMNKIEGRWYIKAKDINPSASIMPLYTYLNNEGHLVLRDRARGGGLYIEFLQNIILESKKEK